MARLQPTQVNYQFKLLYAIGIFMVICGHYGSLVLTIRKILPYDSFHLSMFAFMSGYFYKPEYHESLASVRSYLAKKTRRLLIPYFCWNVVYCGVWLFCNNVLGFSIGSYITLDAACFLLTPFQLARGFEYNVAAWYLMSLFLLETINVLLRHLLDKLGVREQSILTLLYLAIAVGAVLVARSPLESPWKISFCGVLFLMFWFQAGQYYRAKIEPRLTKGGYAVLALGCPAVAAGTNAVFGEADTVVYLARFDGPVALVFLRAGLGIMFWVSVSALLQRFVKRDGILTYMASHTFSLMVHQGLVGLAVNWLIVRHLPGSVLNLDAYRTLLWYNSANGTLCLLVEPVCITVVILLGCKAFDMAKQATMHRA